MWTKNGINCAISGTILSKSVCSGFTISITMFFPLETHLEDEEAEGIRRRMR